MDSFSDEANDRKPLISSKPGHSSNEPYYGAAVHAGGSEGNIQGLPEDEEYDLPGMDSTTMMFRRRDEISPTYRVCNRRWYILTVYWLLSFIQATLWNTWDPITNSAEKAFKLSDGDIGLMENWNNITYIIFIFPFIWLVHKRGLRFPMIVTATIMVIGAFVRCFLYWSPEASKVIINIGQFLIGIAGPVAFFCCTAISATWFPATQRTLATAVMSVAQAGGIAFSFVIGPQLVHFLSRHNPNDPETLRIAIQRLMYGEFVASAVILVMVMVYFPSRPPVPPCESAMQERMPLLKSIKSMCSSLNSVIIFAVYSISAGIFSGWYSLLALAVRNVMGESEAGWLGCWMTVGGIGVSLVTGFLGDRFPKHMKLQVLILLALSGAAFTWFTLTTNEVGNIKYSSPSAWVACIIGGSLAAATQPLCYEVANEAVFPAPEASVTGFLTGLNNFVTMIYIFIQSVPNIGVGWLNWSLAASLWICIPLLLFFRPVYNRLDIDAAAARSSADPAQSFSHNGTNNINNNDNEDSLLPSNVV